VSKVLPEYLKIVLKHVTERVNFIKAKACLYEVLCKDELIGLQCFKQCFIPNSHFATVSFTKFVVDQAKSFISFAFSCNINKLIKS